MKTNIITIYIQVVRTDKVWIWTGNKNRKSFLTDKKCVEDANIFITDLQTTYEACGLQVTVITI